MKSAARLTLRNAQPRDRSAITDTLAAAFADSDVGRWLDPDQDTRHRHALTHFRTTLDRAMSAGTVRVADEQGEILGAALWFHDTPSVAAHDVPTQDVTAHDTSVQDVTAHGNPAQDVTAEGPAQRLRLLERLLAERHPSRPPHHHLAYLGVRRDHWGQGIGSYLLIGYHAYLHVAGIPAYLEANDPRNRELYLRHGYTDVGAPIVLPTGIRIWPMWRPPAPAGAIASAATLSRAGTPLARSARLAFE